MSGSPVQDAIVAVLAAGALAWLVARRLRRRGRPGCEDCPGCSPPPPGARKAPEARLIPLEPFDPRRR